MAKKEFVFQGFSKRTHGDVIRELFNVADIQRVIVSVAFVTENGVQQIEAQLKTNSACVSVFAGVRNDITSYQGLSKIFSIAGKNLYTVDTGSRNVLFHPKLYLVRGKTRARLSIGSANLTLGGLNNNIEAGMMLDFDLSDATEKAMIDGIEKQFSALPAEYPANVVMVGAISKLDEMLAIGRLIDETEVRPPRAKTTVAGTGVIDTTPRIQLKVPAIFRTVAKAGISPKKPSQSKSSGAVGVTLPASASNPAYEAFWESKPLSRRSLTIKSGAKTNPTGSTTLGKGLLSKIDPVTYFRKNIFGHLSWQNYTNKAGHSAERVDASFDLILKGIKVGTFTLTLRHSLTRVAAAAVDKNVPTELCWNDARQFIMRADLIGRKMTLYRDLNNTKHFAVEID
jgi:HKD family nuclease